MSSSLNLVDPELHPILDALNFNLSDDTLAATREMPIFPPVDLASLPVPLAEHTAPVPDSPDVPLLVLNPPSENVQRSAILYIHSGGMVIGSADEVLQQMPEVALRYDCPVVSVEYRLAPETPFPGPQEDCYAALRWMVDHAAELGIDPARISVMGMSAGGGLSASLCQMARDRNEFSIAGQILIIPMLDWRTGGPQDIYKNPVAGEFIWPADCNQYGWQSLRGDYNVQDSRKGWFSPAEASSLSGLPPAYLFAGALDILVDEDVDYARRLMAAGVPTELHVYAGAVHGFNLVPGTALGTQFQADLDRALSKILNSA